MTEKFREYLFSSWCVVFTDNNPLSHLSTAKLGATEHRWAAQLAAFNVKIRYRSGRSNRNADTLSRQNPSESRVVGGLMLGTVVPTSLQQALEIDPAAEVRHSMIVTVPGYSLADLGSLQAVDNS